MLAQLFVQAENFLFHPPNPLFPVSNKPSLGCWGLQFAFDLGLVFLDHLTMTLNPAAKFLAPPHGRAGMVHLADTLYRTYFLN
jgi:hypothetical protein